MKQIMDSHKDELDWSRPSKGPVTNRFMHAMREVVYIRSITEMTEPNKMKGVLREKDSVLTLCNQYVCKADQARRIVQQAKWKNPALPHEVHRFLQKHILEAVFDIEVKIRINRSSIDGQIKQRIGGGEAKSTQVMIFS
jgi:hypothetical protein